MGVLKESLHPSEEVFCVTRQTIERWKREGKLLPGMEIAGRQFYSKRRILDVLGIPYEVEVVKLIKE